MKIYSIFLTFLVTLLIVAGCNSDSQLPVDEETGSETETEVGDVVTVDDIDSENKSNHEESGDYSYDSASITEITLSGNSIVVNGDGATVNGSVVTVTNAGTYRITGSLSDGQVIVNSEDSGKVQLLFNGINVSCSNNAPIYVEQSAKTIIVLEDETENTISDSQTYSSTEEDANAALFSKDNLSITGGGTLTVNGNYNDGITSKDGLIINSGTLIVNAVDDGIRGKDYLIINYANLTINAAGDGLKSDNDSDTTKGFITITDLDAIIIAAGDAIQAETNILISEGEFILASGGGNNANLASDASAKGIKAGSNIVITDGVFDIDSADDALHSNNSLLINGGTFDIASGDDGIHSDSVLEINGGDITITKSYEGIESADITINDGNINLKSSDDGLNVAGGTDGSGFGGGGGGHSAGNYHLYINGATIIVNASGDGIDVNGSFDMTDGTVIVNGPTSNGNGALDYDGSFKITGGFLIAVGSSGMSQAPSSSSTQYSVSAKYSTQQAGQMIHLQKNDGSSIFSFIPEKSYQSIVFSSPELVKGETYSIYLGGSSTGTSIGGLYMDGTYTAGTKKSSFTISNSITSVN